MDKRELQSLIPKDKHDDSTINELMMIPEEEIQEILHDLLMWIADINWPIAKKMIHVLARFPKSLVPMIQKKLSPEEKDDELKFWIIEFLIPLFPVQYQNELITDIKRLCQHPTESEKYGEVDMIAEDFLSSWKE